MTMTTLDRVRILQIVHDPGDTTYLTHNFHPYAAKFIPQIPAYLISTLSSERDRVLDPFCGSGTTLVEAKLLRRRSIGIDIHPLSAFMSRVKTTKVDEEELSKTAPLLKSVKARIERPAEFEYSLPKFKNHDHWFQPHVLQELSIIKTSIERADISQELRDLLLLGFSSIIVSVSNQESETRYAARQKNIIPHQTYQMYRKKILDMVKRMQEFNQRASGSEALVYNADIRDLNLLHEDSVDTIVTSPPYPNTYDYYLYHKQRMNWLGMKWESLKEDEIGSRLKHSSLKMSIGSYLGDMQKGFEHLRRVLRPEAYMAIIIGDSIIRKELLRGDELIDELSQKAGFRTIDSVEYDLGLASKTFNRAFRDRSKREYIILLQNIK
jgi:DNA modification methylase